MISFKRLLSRTDQPLPADAHQFSMQINDFTREDVKLLYHALKAFRLLFVPLPRY
jgi:hypothetical protein